MKTKYLFPETDTEIDAKILLTDRDVALLFVYPFDNFDPFIVIGIWDKRGYYIDSLEPFINVNVDIQDIVKNLNEL
jgi:hypothetical protein